MSEPSQRPYTYWVFCDESADLLTVADDYLIAAAVGTGDLDPLKRAVDYALKTDKKGKGKRTKNTKGKKESSDYRHAADNHQIANALLDKAAEIDDLAIYVALLDKKKIWNNEIKDNLKKYKDSLYNKLFAYLIQQALPMKADTTMPSLIVLERRSLVILEKHDSAKNESDLKFKIRNITSLEEEQIKICSKDNKEWERQLKVADAIAWSTLQKYMREDSEPFEKFHKKVQLESILGIDNNGDLKPVKQLKQYS